MVGGRPMHRVIVAAGFAAGSRVALDDEERHHLRVRRAEAGEPVELLDGRGLVGQGRLVTDGRDLAAAVDTVAQVPEPAAVRLLVGAGDKDRFGWLVEKAVELGVTDLVPIDTDRSRNVATRIRDHHRDKLDRRAAEALKQSGGAWLIRIHAPAPLDRAVAGLLPGPRWLADAAGGPAPTCGAKDPVTVAIGPEGGFTDEERTRLLAAGFEPVRLAARTLRFETAAVAAAVAVSLQRKDAP